MATLISLRWLFICDLFKVVIFTFLNFEHVNLGLDVVLLADRDQDVPVLMLDVPSKAPKLSLLRATKFEKLHEWFQSFYVENV